MKEFFHGWRRKAGIALLMVLAGIVVMRLIIGPVDVYFHDQIQFTL
jgi:hypothetical protein